MARAHQSMRLHIRAVSYFAISPKVLNEATNISNFGVYCIEGLII
jgi:hypothetical protein